MKKILKNLYSKKNKDLDNNFSLENFKSNLDKLNQVFLKDRINFSYHNLSFSLFEAKDSDNYIPRNKEYNLLKDVNWVNMNNSTIKNSVYTNSVFNWLKLNDTKLNNIVFINSEIKWLEVENAILEDIIFINCNVNWLNLKTARVVKNVQFIDCEEFYIER